MHPSMSLAPDRRLGRVLVTASFMAEAQEEVVPGLNARTVYLRGGDDFAGGGYLYGNPVTPCLDGDLGARPS